MSSAQLSPAVPPSVWQMYRAMVGVGLLCGLLIVTVFQVTRPVIERNRAEALQRAIFQVLPDARSSETFVLNADERFELLQGEAAGLRKVYAGYDEQGQLVGLALEASGMGYQDEIRMLYGYAFERDAVVGIQVLETRETPGLGDKIETDQQFLANFHALDVALSEDGLSLAHAIEAVKRGEKEQAWQVDTITGATISSKAIANMLDVSASFWIPRIRRNLDDFRVTE